MVFVATCSLLANHDASSLHNIIPVYDLTNLGFISFYEMTDRIQASQYNLNSSPELLPLPETWNLQSFLPEWDSLFLSPHRASSAIGDAPSRIPTPVQQPIFITDDEVLGPSHCQIGHEAIVSSISREIVEPLPKKELQEPSEVRNNHQEQTIAKKKLFPTYSKRMKIKRRKNQVQIQKETSKRVTMKRGPITNVKRTKKKPRQPSEVYQDERIDKENSFPANSKKENNRRAGRNKLQTAEDESRRGASIKREKKQTRNNSDLEENKENKSSSGFLTRQRQQLKDASAEKIKQQCKFCKKLFVRLNSHVCKTLLKECTYCKFCGKAITMSRYLQKHEKLCQIQPQTRSFAKLLFWPPQ